MIYQYYDIVLLSALPSPWKQLGHQRFNDSLWVLHYFVWFLVSNTTCSNQNQTHAELRMDWGCIGASQLINALQRSLSNYQRSDTWQWYCRFYEFCACIILYLSINSVVLSDFAYTKVLSRMSTCSFLIRSAPKEATAVKKRRLQFVHACNAEEAFC